MKIKVKFIVNDLDILPLRNFILFLIVFLKVSYIYNTIEQ